MASAAERQHLLSDRLLWLFRGVGAFLSMALLFAVLATTLVGAWPAIGHLPEALGSLSWSPGNGEFGMLAMLLASLAVALLATLIAAPLSVWLAGWLNLFAPLGIRHFSRGFLDLMAGIPSVVYGLWGMLFVVPLVARVAPPGASLLAAVLVLAIMILPYGTLLVDSLFRQISPAQRQAADALAISRWGRLWRLYWPMVRAGTVRGIVLQFGRALGETMAVLMVAGNVVQLPDSLFAPVRTLTANVALEMGYAGSEHRAALYLGACFLLALTLLMLARGGKSP
jgi:phosphate transport system permease protein